MNKIPFQLKHGLIFILVTLVYRGNSTILKNCIFDTGAAGTTFDSDFVAPIGIVASPASRIRRLATIGGYERVFTHELDQLSIGDAVFKQIEIEVGDLTSKFAIDGIIGVDVIQKFNWVMDFTSSQLIPSLPSAQGRA
ncbi:MAG: retropepsin-like aspartic protease [Pseudomonadota bacterium]